MDYLRL